jgi:hypothetical protein
MRARSARQTDIGTAMRATAVNVSFSVFPLIALQENLLLDGLADTEIFSVFFRAFFDLSGKHTVKHKNTNGKGYAIENEA